MERRFSFLINEIFASRLHYMCLSRQMKAKSEINVKISISNQVPSCFSYFLCLSDVEIYSRLVHEILFLLKASQYLFSYRIAEVVVCLEREVKSLLCRTQKAF